MKVGVGKLVNCRLSDGAAIYHYIQQCARRQVDAAGVDCEFAATVLTITILGSPARRDTADGRARQRSIEPETAFIAQDVHETRRIGRHRGPDNRTNQRRQEQAKPAIPVKVT